MKDSNRPALASSASELERAKWLVRTVCLHAGSLSFLDDIKLEVQAFGLDQAIKTQDTATIYDWLVRSFSYQGISDQVARGYMEKNGTATWSGLQRALKAHCSCPKLVNYWQYDACRYDKGSRTCSEADHIDDCPVPRPRLRNGRLNQTAFSLFLFIRDIADSNFVQWIDDQLQGASGSHPASALAMRQAALIDPLRNVYGVADKILTMTLSTLLMGASDQKKGWFETGAGMIAIDTLVHNFLHRTGISQGCGKPHSFGPACYRTGGCADVIRQLAHDIDAREFSPSFPAVFPRFIQHAIWRFCAADGLNCCNGNQIDDRQSCRSAYCRLGEKCGRKPLKS